MANTCSICKASDVAEINRRIVAKMASRSIAKEFGVGYSAVVRHGKNCIGPKLKTELTRLNDTADLANQIHSTEADLHKHATEVLGLVRARLDALDKSSNVKDFALLVRELRECVILTGRLIGAFSKENATTINIDNRQQKLELLSRLADDFLFPESRVIALPVPAEALDAAFIDTVRAETA